MPFVPSPLEATAPPDPDLQSFEQITDYSRSERLPWRRARHGAHHELRAAEAFRERAGEPRFPLRRIDALPRRAFQDVLKQRFERQLVDASINSLSRTAPNVSARSLLNRSQKALAVLAILLIAVSFAAAPLPTLIALNAGVTVYFLAAIAFRSWLITVSLTQKSAPPAPPLADARLPVITILLPVYDEAEGLPILKEAIGAIDYPRNKLDIKLLLEADDAATIDEARRLELEEVFDCVVVPASQPRTKPKACNYALYLARGEIVVIYDAEDIPETDQLRKAAAAFATGGPDLACVQAQLNYYNADETWLTRLFSLEYALWFDNLLPALDRLRVPIPLGGTSNFIRTDILRAVGGWDPFNVTEDADLGLRLARAGFRTQMLASTTLEEANCRVKNWIRQRSRWMKGYMQTWCVHLRAPEAGRSDDWRWHAAVNLFIAGNFFSALVNPVLWTVFAIWLLSRTEAISAAFPGPLLALNLFALVFGNCFFIYLNIIAPLKRGWAHLSAYGLLAPAYWWLTSVAAYKALWQLMTRPYFWEKTDHMLSSSAKALRAEACARGRQ